MCPSAGNEKRFQDLKSALNRDGFTVIDFTKDSRYNSWSQSGGYLEFQGQIGIAAENLNALNAQTGRPKKAYYLEGSGKQMGTLMGLMAESEISLMAVNYSENVVLELIHVEKLGSSKLIKMIQNILINLLGDGCEKSMKEDIPLTYRQELEGIFEG